MGEPELEPGSKNADLESLLARLREIQPMEIKSLGISEVPEGIKIQGELTGMLIKANEELIDTNKKMLTSLSATERLTRVLTGLTSALLVLAILGIMVSTPWGQLPWWQFLARFIAIAVLLGLLSFFLSSAWREYFGKERAGGKGT